MAGKSLEFHQIFYSDEQKEFLYPFAKPYKNEKLNLTFENAVIAELVPKATEDLVSVCSWRLRNKRSDGGSEPILKRNGTFELTEEKIKETDFDVAILTPRGHKNIVEKFILWHAPHGVEALAEFRKFIKVPDIVENAIYENHFIARRELYQEYVSSCLIQAINFISDKEVFWLDSGYVSKKKNWDEIKDFREKTGRQDWPLAPFILERLFSIWINKKGFKVINL